jgi:hypothetical protein
MGVQFAGNILIQSNGGPLPISAGGTGQTTSPTAINALLPTQIGQSGKVLSSDGTNVSWSAAAGGSPGGADTQIQYNDAGTFGGGSFLSINKTTGAITSTSTLTNRGILVSDAASTIRSLKLQTAGSDRWLLQANSTAEGGGDAGTNFEFVRVADNGATQNQVFTVARSTGVVDFKAAPTVNGSAITSTAGTLTGTTLASNVVSSSLTSVGTLGSLGVTGTVTAGAFSGPLTGNASTATTLATARNINGVSFNGSTDITVAAAAGTLTGSTLNSTVTASSLTSLGTQQQSLNMGGFSVANAAAPTVGTDLTTKNYVDAAIAGLNWKTSVKAATTTNITLSGTQVIDNVILSVGDRVLVKNQTTVSQNGVYVVAAGAWTRSTDADTAAEVDGSAVFVLQGTTLADTGWTETAVVTTLGTDNVVYVQFSGSGTYTAGTGISLTGNTFANTGVTSLTGTANQVTVSASTGGVTVSLPSAITIAGTMTAGTFSGPLTGNVTGASSLNVLKTGDTMTGSLTVTTGTDSSTYRVGILLEGGAVNTGSVSPALTFSGSNPNAAIWSSRYSGYGGDLIFGTQLVSGSFANPTERMRITAAGDVGIGTTTPGSKLDIGGTTVSETITFSQTSANTAARQVMNIGYKTGAYPGGSLLAGYSETGFDDSVGLRFYSGSGLPERMRIDSTGNVGIGTNSPQRKLQITGDAGLGIQPTNGDGITTLGALSTGITTLDCYHGSIPAQFVVRTNTTGGAGSSEKLRVTGTGQLYGTALHNNSAGATGATNQYIASGTYTPTIVNGANVNSSAAVPCNWMRVGNIVTVSGYVFVSLGAGATTDFTMSYPIASTASNTGAVGGTATAGYITTAFAIGVDGTNGRARFMGESSATGNANVYFSFMYLIT